MLEESFTSFIRHPDKSRGLLNSFDAGSTAQIALIEWILACAGMTMSGVGTQ
jgi:hypothetical protein